MLNEKTSTVLSRYECYVGNAVLRKGKKMTGFEKLLVWQKSKELYQEVLAC